MLKYAFFTGNEAVRAVAEELIPHHESPKDRYLTLSWAICTSFSPGKIQ